MESQQIRDFLVEKFWQFGEHFQREQRTANAEVHVLILRNIGACLNAAHHNRIDDLMRLVLEESVLRRRVWLAIWIGQILVHRFDYVIL